MSLEALESAASQINGERAPQVGVEHDPTLPPIGKVIKAEILPTGDGEHDLIGYQEIFERSAMTRLPDGTLAVKYSSAVDRRPFVIGRVFSGDKLGIAYDGVNFGSNDDLDAFVAEVTLGGELKFEERDIFRKSVLPDPEVIFGFAKVVGTYLAGKKVFDKVGSQVAEDIGTDLAKLYRSIRNTAFAAAKYCIPKNRPITYIFIALEQPVLVEFAIQTADPKRVADHVTIALLEKPLEKALELHKTMGAEKVQFRLHEAGTWDLNYLLTSTGDVIGTQVSMKRRSKRMRLMREAKTQPEGVEPPNEGQIRRAIRKRSSAIKGADGTTS